MAKLILGVALKRRGLTKYAFAKRLKVPYQQVFQYFRPGYNPTLKTMSAWAKAIGCKVRDLIKE